MAGEDGSLVEQVLIMLLRYVRIRTGMSNILYRQVMLKCFHASMLLCTLLHGHATPNMLKNECKCLCTHARNLNPTLPHTPPPRLDPNL